MSPSGSRGSMLLKLCEVPTVSVGLGCLHRGTLASDPRWGFASRLPRGSVIRGELLQQMGDFPPFMLWVWGLHHLSAPSVGVWQTSVAGPERPQDRRVLCLVGDGPLPWGQGLSSSSAPARSWVGGLMPTGHLGNRLGRDETLTSKSSRVRRKCQDSNVSPTPYSLCGRGQVLHPLSLVSVSGKRGHTHLWGMGGCPWGVGGCPWGMGGCAWRRGRA